MTVALLNLFCCCTSRWLKYITEAADVYKDTNPLKTPPRMPKAPRVAKPVTMSDLPEASEVLVFYLLHCLVNCWGCLELD